MSNAHTCDTNCQINMVIYIYNSAIQIEMGGDDMSPSYIKRATRQTHAEYLVSRRAPAQHLVRMMNWAVLQEKTCYNNRQITMGVPHQKQLCIFHRYIIPFRMTLPDFGAWRLQVPRKMTCRMMGIEDQHVFTLLVGSNFESTYSTKQNARTKSS